MKIKKQVFRTIVVFLICFSMLGCEKKEETTEQTVNQVDLDKLQKVMLEADETLPEMQINNSEDANAELNFTSLSNMDYSRIAGYFYAYSKKGTAEEVAVIQLKDAKDEAVLMQSLQKHIDSRIGALQEYSPEQVSLAENALIIRESGCVALIVSEKNGLIQNAFENFWKE